MVISGRSMFSRNKSCNTQESNEQTRSNNGDKRKWGAVRSYLCGDECNSSVLGEEDSASVKSSEATVTQPVLEDSTDVEVAQTEETKESRKEKHNSFSNLFRRDDAAIIIQAAFRNYLARRPKKELESTDDKKEVAIPESPSRDSVGTSVEVQTGNSVDAVSIGEKDVAALHRVTKKTRNQVLKLKEEWDDSTVSSNVTKMRIQNRLEATNRRERALAYAFSQQLRVCSKKNQAKAGGTQSNLSWSWLERWMASRPECSVESCTGKQLERMNSLQELDFRKRIFDVAVEEKESCGSNDVSVQFDCLSISTESVKDSFRPTKSRLKTTRSISRRKTVPSSQCPKEQAKVTRKERPKENDQDKEHKPRPQDKAAEKK